MLIAKIVLSIVPMWHEQLPYYNITLNSPHPHHYRTDKPLMLPRVLVRTTLEQTNLIRPTIKGTRPRSSYHGGDKPLQRNVALVRGKTVPGRDLSGEDRVREGRDRGTCPLHGGTDDTIAVCATYERWMMLFFSSTATSVLFLLISFQTISFMPKTPKTPSDL